MTTAAPTLAPLRARLAALHRARRSARWSAAWSALATSVLAALGTLAALDVSFELSVVQRLIMIALAAGFVIWSYRRFSCGLLAFRESLLEVALQVERRHGIDTDLVAALQFESPDAVAWGSRQLEHSVIDQASSRGQQIDVFAGFDRGLSNRRLGWLAVIGGGVLIAVILYPGHARVFFNRLLLGSQHYPTATRIERLAINDQLVLDEARDGTSPRRSAAAQSRSLTFLARVTGIRPTSGIVRVGSLRGGATRPVELSEMSDEERRQPLTMALRAIEDLAHDPTASGPTIDDAAVLPYLDCESPRAAQSWREARDGQAAWTAAQAEIQALLAEWETRSAQATVLRGELGRLVESIEYKVFLGDAWTDTAEVAMTPRPLVEPRLSAKAPDYATSADAVRELGPGRLTALEGSSVSVGLECTNNKRLRDAWLTLLTLNGPRRFDLRPVNDEQTAWTLKADNSPFHRLEEDLRFELQVRDEDGLTLETPLAGIVRVQPDRIPSGTLQLVHKVVLPTARPVLQYRVLDDHAVERIVLHLEVVRRENDASRVGAESAAGTGETADAGETAGASDAETDGNRQSILLSQANEILRGSQLPVRGSRPIDLGALKLEKGDRLIMVLEVTDHRGSTPGKSYQSEPLTLDISDEAGVLSAVLEADEKAEERLSEIIKRQLGIGESP